jgi:hypothetical protein
MTVPRKRSLEIALVYPQVGAVLDPNEDWHRLVISTIISIVGIIVEYRRPQDSPAFLGCYSQIQLGKWAPPPSFSSISLRLKKSQNTNSLRTLSKVWNVFVVHCIVLTLLVAQWPNGCRLQSSGNTVLHESDGHHLSGDSAAERVLTLNDELIETVKELKYLGRILLDNASDEPCANHNLTIAIASYNLTLGRTQY